MTHDEPLERLRRSSGLDLKSGGLTSIARKALAPVSTRFAPAISRTSRQRLYRVGLLG
jgi:hypothetical protein